MAERDEWDLTLWPSITPSDLNCADMVVCGHLNVSILPSKHSKLILRLDRKYGKGT